VARRGAPGGRGVSRLAIDPLTGTTAEVRRVQPYAATKPYRCPGCSQEVPVGTGHVVVVPLQAPDERRHWHGACWEQRARRPPGR